MYIYPLPLVPAALEILRGATIFTKLDLARTLSSGYGGGMNGRLPS